MPHAQDKPLGVNGVTHEEGVPLAPTGERCGAHRQAHCGGILRWFDSKIVHCQTEGINSLVQTAKAKARGYRSIRNLKAWSTYSPARSIRSCLRYHVSTHARKRRTRYPIGDNGCGVESYRARLFRRR